MRLGQIARKLSISPSEVLGYLATRDIIIEENANSRLENDHVRLILQKFAPEQLSILDVQPSPAITPEPAQEHPRQESIIKADADPVQEMELSSAEPVVDQNAELNSTSESSSEPMPEGSEVIKAPKVALSGLKVLGKIDLPEPKKKEPDSPGTESESPAKEEQPRRSSQPRKQSYEQRSYKNPVSLQRDREMKEEMQKRQEKAEKEKERRTQNYLKKVNMSPPTKAMRLVEEPLEQMTHEQLKEEPKTWFGKFIKWLST
jgi:hypothetical protein